MNRLFLLIVLISFPVFSQVPFTTSPNWISSDAYNVATGGAFADINNDGWLDLVTANGNDISRQKISVYYNDGAGNLPNQPSWNSSDIDYHGHLDVGDINNDGWTDVVVSVYIGSGGFGTKGKVKLYLNNQGTLSSTPDWVSADEFYTFSCALGDADNDGDLDLAVATGESYTATPEKFRIYFNNSGTFESLPSWESQNASYAYDVNWFDVDKDGDLDLVFACEQSPNKLFLNNNGVIETTPSWQSTDASQQANSLALGDVNNDGYLDLAISDNNQLGGQGKFKLYLNNNGTLETTPFWTSSFSGTGSGIFLHDLNNDGFDDLITGGWWQPMRIYMNNNGSFNSNPEYTSSTGSVIEVIVIGDINKDGNVTLNYNFPNDGKKIIYLPKVPLQSINYISFDTSSVDVNNYCYDLETGWISFNDIPVNVNNIIINADISYNQDIAITNWDSSIGNYIFINQNPPVPVELTDLSAKLDNQYVVLNWKTKTETNNRGFEIQRSLKKLVWTTIGFKEGNGTSTFNNNYTYSDNVSSLNSAEVFYRLKQVDFNGKSKFSNIISVSLTPITFELMQNFPNPFNPSTNIGFRISESGFVSLKIYDELGRQIKTLINKNLKPGFYEVNFDGTELPSGIYFYRIQTGNHSSIKKMILIK